MATPFDKHSSQIDVWQNHHHHSKDFKKNCNECMNYIEEDDRYGCMPSDTFKVQWHYICDIITSLKDTSHLYHPNHTLKLLCNGPPRYSNGKCHLCQHKFGSYVYHCSLCDFNMHLKCFRKPLRLTVEASKCHEHTLALMVGPVSFTCHECGTCGEQSPYVCPPCFVMYHPDCINLPRVIYINLHHHRVSYTKSLPLGDWICEICRKEINWRYGSYSCKVCPDVIVHSKCATRSDVWDGKEDEGMPEGVEDIAPFKMIEYGIINHFSHKKHNLKLTEDVIITNGGEGIRCEACARSIYSGNHYSCMECNFFLHQKCAKLPLLKRHVLFTEPLSLHTQKPNTGYFRCKACWRVANGFVYMCPDGSGVLDVGCAMLSKFIDFHLHPHPIFFTTSEIGTCGACKESTYTVSHCVECNFSLDFECATLPKRIMHECDDHFLFLRCGTDIMGKYWCEVCESRLDSTNWFYSCGDCGVVCHVECVLGEFANIKPGIVATNDVGEKVELIPNEGLICSKCGVRSCLPYIFKVYFYRKEAVYFCCSLASEELRYFN